ncbi:hypothetical protein HY772_10235 [Candidatus Woesearchaeota archaeon]|nr:hypothetical protein [Candidatus Woesearchaeota archaeon]
MSLQLLNAITSTLKQQFPRATDAEILAQASKIYREALRSSVKFSKVQQQQRQQQIEWLRRNIEEDGKRLKQRTKPKGLFGIFGGSDEPQ